MIRKALSDAWKMIPKNFRRRMVRVSNDKFTVSAAAVIVNDEGEVLLLEHVLRPGTGWGLPGGFLKKGEQPELGIRREIREEIGIELDELSILRVWTFGPHLEIVFTALPIGEPKVKTREIFGLGWFAGDHLPEGIPCSQKLVINEVLKGRI